MRKTVIMMDDVVKCREMEGNKFQVLIPTVKSKQELISELADKLHFPDYFGYNWDALCEVLRDFYWVNEKIIMIEHHGISTIPVADLETYLEIISEVEKFWEEDKSHEVLFLFSSTDMKIIERFRISQNACQYL